MKPSKVLIFCLVLFALLAALTKGAPEGSDYSKENRALFERIFSPRKFPKDRWHFVGLPLSGNVLGTARLNEKNIPVEDRVKLINPDRWYDSSVGSAERAALDKAIIDTYSVGPIDLDESMSRTSGGSLSFPGFFQILGIGAGITSQKGVTVKMHIDKATVRELNFNEFSKAYNQRKFDPSVYEALKQDLIMCFADVQFTGLKINLTLDMSKHANLDAKLTENVGKVLGKESAVGIKLDKKGTGSFVIEPVGTVTVAYLFRPIPKKGREVDPSGYLLLNPPRGEAPVVSTDDALENELRRVLGALAMSQELGGTTGGISQQDLELIEEQSGDPSMRTEGLALDDTTKKSIEEFLARPSRGPKVNRPQLALKTLDVARTHVGTTRRNSEAQVRQYLALYGLPFRYPNGQLVPFCAAGLGFASCQAYRQLTGQSANLNDPNVAVIFRDSLTDVKRDMARTHPAVREMVASARQNGTWQSPTNPDGTRVIPKPGWLVAYNWSGGTTPQHIGIVDNGSTSREIHTIEFNTADRNNSNGGAVLTRKRGYGPVLGYIDTYKEPTSH
jgi:hypothetical protein